jgi:hypothetical protein
MKSRPHVWIDASFVKSPWVTSDAVRHDGVLAVWRVRRGTAPPAPIAQLPGLVVLGVKSFAWPRTPHAQPLQIGYGIEMPVAGNK